ncbi:stress-activated protein kinase alpha-like [Schistocerca gregaria]|uniref:stress-activated protein kinase alpha-like n=1 Tax=Schistocerca gregaria TaxID=7010 RepID=UPI00211E9F57|nr:stress-activated protein kinase alpha-like [Schistocerca gregaria]
MKFILHEKTLLSYVSVAKLNTDVPPQVLSGSEVIEGWYNFKSIKAGKNFTGSLQLQIKAVRMTKLVRGKLKYANGETNTSDLFDLIYQNDYPGIIQYLEMATAEDVNRREPRTGNTCLHVACLESKNLDSRILISLLEFDGIEVHVPNTDLNTPLHFFCAKWRSPELHALNLMLEKGAQVNFANSNKETPIFKAIFNECIRALLMKTLIDHGAQVNVLNFFGESVLHYAVRFGRSDLVSIILESSPELNIVGKDNLTPYELAVQYKDKNIANYLKTVSELFDWLDNHQLGAFKQTFLKNEIYLPVLPDLNADFLEKMGICADDQQKILAETAKLKNEITFTTSKADLTTDEEDSQYEDDSDYIERIEKMKQQMGVSAQQQYFNLNFDDAEIEYVKHLGTGVSGDVYKVFVNNRQMAVKVFKSMDMISEDEFQILLASRHPNIVGLYGVCTEPRFCLVMEYCSRGSLYHVLKGHTLQLEWNLIFKMFYEITSGLDALHSHKPQILHRDLKTLNLLVTDKWQVKVADFGLSRFNTAEASKHSNKFVERYAIVHRKVISTCSTQTKAIFIR